MGRELFNDLLKGRSFSLDEVDFSTITTQAQMIKTFIMFENDTILFYEFLDTFIEAADVKQGLQKIIREEASHVEKLSAMIQSDPNLPVED